MLDSHGDCTVRGGVDFVTRKEQWAGSQCRLINVVPCFSTHTHTEGVRNLAVSLNRPGLFSICRENLSMWEKIACGEVEDIVPSPPYDSGPVKVDN